MEENIIEIAPVEYRQDEIAVILPKEVAGYLKIGPKSKNKTVFFTLTNKVVQLSAGKPISTLRFLTEDNMEFQEQSS